MHILLLFAALLLFLLLFPVRVRFSLEDGRLSLSVRYLLLRRSLLPGEEGKTQKSVKKKKKKSSGKSQPKKSFLETVRKTPTGELLPLLSDTVGRCRRSVRRFLRHTSLAHFSLTLTVVGEDAADTALRYGRYQSVIPLAIAAADRTVRLQCDRIDLIPGFAAETERLFLSGEVRLCPAAVLAVLCNLAWIALSAYLRLKKTEKPGKEVWNDGKAASDQ